MHVSGELIARHNATARRAVEAGFLRDAEASISRAFGVVSMAPPGSVPLESVAVSHLLLGRICAARGDRAAARRADADADRLFREANARSGREGFHCDDRRPVVIAGYTLVRVSDDGLVSALGYFATREEAEDWRASIARPPGGGWIVTEIAARDGARGDLGDMLATISGALGPDR